MTSGHCTQSGADRELHRARALGVPIIGICGGYQMLGTTLVDAGFESAAGTYAGLGLLDCITHFRSYDKNTTQVTRHRPGYLPDSLGNGDCDRL